jgi:hypothetical protein
MNTPDPKQQLVERIEKMCNDHNLEWEVPLGQDALVEAHKFYEAIASAWLEDVEKLETRLNKMRASREEWRALAKKAIKNV